jgi:FdrA protein
MTGPSTEHVEVRPGAYADSVALLQVSRDVATTPGVLAAQVAMATPLNIEVLTGMGFSVPTATRNDMVVALRVQDEQALAGALAAVDAALVAASRSAAGAAEVAPPRTTRTALRDAGAGLALVSVPGPHAFVGAMDALDAGRDVMVFSDNVPLDQELALKRTAAERGLLVMGPDCGTAVVGGVGLGFANTAAPGPVGIVAASGTGCQQLMCLLDFAGVGVGAALGVGGRDLSAEVGALATRVALARLDADPEIGHVVLVSKPPAAEVAAALREYAGTLDTPVTFALLGSGEPDLTTAAEVLLAALGVPVPAWPSWGGPARAGTGLVRGLFVGGTLKSEAELIVTAALGPGHMFIDFGDDAYTEGRAHPMIDPTLRLEHLARAAADPDTGVLLLDVVLGHGAEPDPAAALAPALAGVTQPVVVACVGTEADPQVLSRQAEALAGTGAEVHLSNAAAARRAVELAGGAR